MFYLCFYVYMIDHVCFISNNLRMNTDKSCKKARVAPGPASDMHPADIKCALEKAGWSLRQLAKINGLSPTAVGHAFRRRYPRAEKIIADALSTKPWNIWPTRYDESRNPIQERRGRPCAKYFKPKDSTETVETRQGAEQ